jgi:negative regulator of flagellin synthesis FlgM
MSKIDNTNFRAPFFPGQTKSSTRLKARNDASRKAELDEISKDHASVKINQKIKDFSRIKKVVDSAPEIDNSEKIQALKKLISAGKYQINEGKIADKIMEREY